MSVYSVTEYSSSKFTATAAATANEGLEVSSV